MLDIIEGPNGAGKTTLIGDLNLYGYNTFSSPNGTPAAKYVRPLARGMDEWHTLDPFVKFMFFSAARYDEYVSLVHNSGKRWYVDRWWTSTYIYQCLLGNIPVSTLEATIHPEEQVNMVHILTADDEALIARVVQEREANEAHGRCSWTRDEQTIIDLNKLYVNELPKFLEKKGIPFQIIDNTNLSTDQVLQRVVKK